MEKRVLFRDRQEFQAADPNALQDYARDSIDHVVEDGISDQSHYVGLDTASTTTTDIEVQPGRFYTAGEVYVFEQVVSFNLFAHVPLTTNKIVVVGVWGQDVDTNIEPRDFLVDLVTNATEPSAVAMEQVRKAEISIIPGTEAAVPQAPSLQVGTLAVAYVYMTPAGIDKIVMQTGSLLPNSYDQEQRISGIEIWRDGAEPRISSIATDLAALAKKASSKAERSAFVDLAADLASVKEKLQLPATFSSYEADSFATVAKSNEGHAGYSARIDNGLLFPFAASGQFNLALFNPIDPSVKVSGQNIVLPLYTHVARIQTQGFLEGISISQYQSQTHTVRERQVVTWDLKYGTGSNFYNKWYIRNLWDELDLDYDWDNPHYGYYEQHKQTVYEDVVTTVNYSGAIIAQTFLVANAMWLTRVGLFFTQVAASGDVQLLVCETDGGKPDIDKAVTSVTLSQVDMLTHPTETVVDVPHVLLESGKRYAIVLITQGDHYAALVSGNEFTQGTFFYGSDSEYFEGDLTKDLMFTVYGAKFTNARTVVQLQSVSLAGGMSDIFLTTPQVVPEGTELFYEIQPAGTGAWYRLGDPSLQLASEPNLVNLRAVLLGTSDLTPAFALTNNAITASLPDVSLTHWSVARTVASTTSVTLKILVANWVGANHTLAPVIVTAGPVETSPSTTVEESEDGATRFTYTFTIPASTSYEVKIVATRTAGTNPFAIAERIDVAVS